ncbi:hypothetical protein ABW19_dt0203491 [Dactylella cylindrospora]|nr:hypothetical protein ABW19_dt0203491 [Dactylella cylindrospora]
MQVFDLEITRQLGKGRKIRWNTTVSMSSNSKTSDEKSKRRKTKEKKKEGRYASVKSPYSGSRYNNIALAARWTGFEIPREQKRSGEIEHFTPRHTKQKKDAVL